MYNCEDKKNQYGPSQQMLSNSEDNVHCCRSKIKQKYETEQNDYTRAKN